MSFVTKIESFKWIVLGTYDKPWLVRGREIDSAFTRERVAFEDQEGWDVVCRFHDGRELPIFWCVFEWDADFYVEQISWFIDPSTEVQGNLSLDLCLCEQGDNGVYAKEQTRGLEEVAP